MTRFSLDVDPAAVRSAARSVAALQGEVEDAAARLDALLPQVQASWTGLAATALTAESAGLRAQVVLAAAHFAAAGAALAALGEAYDQAREVDLPLLEQAWERAEEEHRCAVAARLQQQSAYVEAVLGLELAAAQGPPGAVGRPRRTPPLVTAPTIEDSDAVLAAEQARLEREFEDLREQLRRRTRETGGDLAAATVVPVPDALAGGYAAGGMFSGLAGWLGAGAGVFALKGALPLTAVSLHVLYAAPAGQRIAAGAGRRSARRRARAAGLQGRARGLLEGQGVRSGRHRPGQLGPLQRCRPQPREHPRGLRVLRPALPGPPGARVGGPGQPGRAGLRRRLLRP